MRTASSVWPRRASPRATPTAPAARCRRRSLPGWRRAWPRRGRARRQELRHDGDRRRGPAVDRVGHRFEPWSGPSFLSLLGERRRCTPIQERAMTQVTRRRLVQSGATGVSAPWPRPRCARRRPNAGAWSPRGRSACPVPACPRNASPSASDRCPAGVSTSRSTPRARSCRPSRCSMPVGGGVGRDRPHRRVLLAGQDAGRGVLHHRAVRADARRARRLGRRRRRPGAVGRALRAVRRQALHGRQHRRLHGRLVPERDQKPRRSRRHQDPLARLGRRGLSKARRRRRRPRRRRRFSPACSPA